MTIVRVISKKIVKDLFIHKVDFYTSTLTSAASGFPDLLNHSTIGNIILMIFINQKEIYILYRNGRILIIGKIG